MTRDALRGTGAVKAIDRKLQKDAGVTGSSVNDFVEHYRAAGLFGCGCSALEIAALEERYGVQLPAAYRAFLLIAGKGPNPRLVGSEWEFRCLGSLREWADELLAECGHPFALPANAFVFFMHQGYYFQYFMCADREPDPPTFQYQEGRPSAVQADGKISRWVKWNFPSCL